MMDYNSLLDIAMKVGYRLAMCGAETFRIEESVTRIMLAYGVNAEVFSIPNLLLINIETPDGQTLTRMRRIGHHGNDLDAVERYSNLSRKICNEVPGPDVVVQWIHDTDRSRKKYILPLHLSGNFLGACGFAVFFGGALIDSICAGFCGVLVGLANHFMSRLKVNPFFSTIVSAFILALTAYTVGHLGISPNTDSVIIGTLMILVPGLLFTNAMRDIIFGDTNSGINRIVQVLLMAIAIAIGTGAAWSLSGLFWGSPVASVQDSWTLVVQCVAGFVGCIGFAMLFNIHGPGILLCAVGGTITWAAYGITYYLWQSEVAAYFLAAVVAAIYSETMARIRKYPATSYLVVSIFPLLPGAGIYYTTSYLVTGDMQRFGDTGLQTAAIAGALAMGILIVSTLVRLWGVWKRQRRIR